MYQAILHTHSGLRWIVLILIVAAIFNALTAKGRTEYSKKDRLLNLFAMVSMHLQVVIGVILSLTTEKVFYHEGWMKSSASRFFWNGTHFNDANCCSCINNWAQKS